MMFVGDIADNARRSDSAQVIHRIGHNLTNHGPSADMAQCDLVTLDFSRAIFTQTPPLRLRRHIGVGHHVHVEPASQLFGRVTQHFSQRRIYENQAPLLDQEYTVPAIFHQRSVQSFRLAEGSLHRCLFADIRHRAFEEQQGPIGISDRAGVLRDNPCAAIKPPDPHPEAGQRSCGTQQGSKLARLTLIVIYPTGVIRVGAQELLRCRCTQEAGHCRIGVNEAARRQAPVHPLARL